MNFEGNENFTEALGNEKFREFRGVWEKNENGK